jgi:DNA-binding transcriptional MerR regulator
MNEDGTPVVDPLVSIGVFARRSRLSMKALRLYDRRGLLTPADVDPDTGYRRYRESQLVTARLIVMLRRLNMPLAQVAELVAAPAAVRAELLASYWETIERRGRPAELMTHLTRKLLGDEGSVSLPDVQERGFLSSWCSASDAACRSNSCRPGSEPR